MRETILALDFDGTLYRIEDRDSEKMLADDAAWSPEEKELLRSTMEKIHDGSEPPSSFNPTYKALLMGKPASLADDVLERVLDLADMNELEVLKDIAKKDNVHMHIVSCGTDLIIKPFLERTGLLPYTESINSKEVPVENGVFTDLIRHLKGGDDKRKKVIELRKAYDDPFLVAIGDGGSDRGMIEEADLGLFIEWPGGQACREKGEKIHSYTELHAELRELGLI